MFQKVEKQIRALLKESVEGYLRISPSAVPHSLPQQLLDDLVLEIPKEKGFGDLSASIAMKLSRSLQRSPKQIAVGITEEIKKIIVRKGSRSPVRFAEAKGAGFINIFLKDEVFFDLLSSIGKKGREFGRSDIGKGRRLLLEFVSANPTGPLSVAHARQAAVGDSLANVLTAMGWRVTREYYLNDEGNQINILGRSISLRFDELLGETVVFPDDHYQGTYIVDLARGLFEDPAMRARIEKMSLEKKDGFFRDYGVEQILGIIKKELEDFAVTFDVWYSQRKLGASGKIEKALARLKKAGFLYEAEGAVWFKSTAFGDDKDRVVRKSDGSYTYLAPDIAYHEDKFRRGFDRLVNIWGPDHHGYIPRMRSAVQALGKPLSSFDVIVVQLATLFRNGQPAPMSTRKGQYVTLREVLSEVGLDASRFFFLMRKTDSHLDFDLELAKKQTSDNPVYYVQYAHARICGILAGAQEKTWARKDIDLSLLKEEEEKDLMKALFGYSYCLEVCCRQLDPYGLTVYLQSLAASFHKFYDKHKVLSADDALTRARLFLIQAVKTVLANGLRAMGVAAPERM